MLDQQLIVGSNYRLKFKGAFERHGVCTTSGLTCLHSGNGVFRLEQISSFRDIVMAGVKLYNNFFAPVGISEEEYQAYFSDKPEDEFTPEYMTKMVYDETESQELVQDETSTSKISVKTKTTITGHEVFVESGKSLIKKHSTDSVNYANYPIYKFVDVIDDSDAIYVPELTIDGFPEIEINEYKDLHLTFHLGLFDNPALLDPMLLAIRERMAVYGIKPKHIKLYSTGSKWLNPDEYEALKSLRVPGDIDTIPADAKFEDYQGDHLIINGQVKEIVETVNPARINEQVAFEELKSGDTVIDNDLFLETVHPGDTFSKDKVYYEQVKWTENVEDVTAPGGVRDVDRYALHVMDPVECPNGDEIMRFKEVEAEYVVATGKAQKDVNYFTKGVYQYIPPTTATFEADKVYGATIDGEMVRMLPVTSGTETYVKIENKDQRFLQLMDYYYKDADENYVKLTAVNPAVETLNTYEYIAGITMMSSKTYDIYLKEYVVPRNKYIIGTTTFAEKFTIYGDSIYQFFEDKYQYLRINVGEDLPTSPACYTMTSASVENKFMAVPGDYVLLAYGEARSNSSSGGEGYMRELTETNLTADEIAKDPDKYFWIKTTVQTTGGESQVVWKTATLTEAGDPTYPIYRKMITTYQSANLTAKSLYTSRPRFNVGPNEEVLPGPVKGTGIFKYEDYVREPALKLVGTTFEYLNEHGHKKTNILELIDIIEFCGYSKQLTLTWTSGGEGYIDRLWEKYNGRKFRYTMEKEYTNPENLSETLTQSVPVEVVISDDIKGQLAGKTGLIMGQDGTISRSLYFVKDTTLKRNYYLQYIVLKNQYDILMDKYNKLEGHVLANAKHVSA